MSCWICCIAWEPACATGPLYVEDELAILENFRLEELAEYEEVTDAILGDAAKRSSAAVSEPVSDRCERLVN
jgi:hypothetical protein